LLRYFWIVANVAQKACILHPPAHIVIIALLGDMAKGTPVVAVVIVILVKKKSESKVFPLQA
jgi:hypothetical protein